MAIISVWLPQAQTLAFTHHTFTDLLSTPSNLLKPASNYLLAETIATANPWCETPLNLSSILHPSPPSLSPSLFLPPSLSLLHASKGPGPIQPQMTLKKLNWRRQNLSPLAGSGGAIWKELPKVEIPKEKFCHLFAQRTVVKEKEGPVSASLSCVP